MKVSIKHILVFSLLAFTVFACSLLAAPTADVLPPTVPPLVEPIELKASPFSEESQTPAYKITAQIPYLDPATNPSTQAFNTYVKSVVDTEIIGFKSMLAGLPATPIGAGSSFDVQYQLIGQKGSIWSICFNIMGYAEGAAHPYTYSVTVNYDLANGKPLQLGDLFLSNSNYLQIISDYSKSDLSTRDLGFEDGFQQGADPTPENYKNWNLSNEGFLVITFDQGQVGPYAAGSPVVTIAFTSLEQVINPQGPLAPFLQK